MCFNEGKLYIFTTASESSRNLWVSGLSSGTKAADLKVLFGKHGKVSFWMYICACLVIRIDSWTFQFMAGYRLSTVIYCIVLHHIPGHNFSSLLSFVFMFCSDASVFFSNTCSMRAYSFTFCAYNFSLVVCHCQHVGGHWYLIASRMNVMKFCSCAFTTSNYLFYSLQRISWQKNRRWVNIFIAHKQTTLTVLHKKKWDDSGT